MSEVINNILYEREKDGVKVVARQEVTTEEIVKGEGKVETKTKRTYFVEGFVNREMVRQIPGQGYRGTIKQGRAMFKELYAEYGPKKEKEAEEAAKDDAF
jgi:hypothetical protein